MSARSFSLPLRHLLIGPISRSRNAGKHGIGARWRSEPGTPHHRAVPPARRRRPEVRPPQHGASGDLRAGQQEGHARRTLPNLSDRDELDPLIVRTHYGDDRAWDALQQLLLPPAQDADTDVPCFVDDPQWDGASVDDVLAAVAADEELRKHLRVVFLADRLTMEAVDQPLLVVTTTTRDECEDDEEWEFVVEYGREFRAVHGLLMGHQAGDGLDGVDPLAHRQRSWVHARRSCRDHACPAQRRSVPNARTAQLARPRPGCGRAVAHAAVVSACSTSGCRCRRSSTAGAPYRSRSPGP
ncbi:DUF6924 domain-containing protein [Streptomyces sp. HC307]|uniref:DUF6924 domain-containing protein n=1 Tax=Streptomyces flavusporus TaxID=3385496 RepID=UPI003916D92E